MVGKSLVKRIITIPEIGSNFFISSFMNNNIFKHIFFGNYFVGFLSVLLSIETSFQLRLPFNSIIFYLLLFFTTVMYYTYAYSNNLQTSNHDNPRLKWYFKNRNHIKYKQIFFLVITIILTSLLLQDDYSNLVYISPAYWIIILITFLAAIFYYGMLPKSLFNLNIRNIGWLKAFIIGFVWACAVSLLPIIELKMEHGYFKSDSILTIGLFMKNWMFCSINAIIFDIKDYEDDSNVQLKTFVVRFGIQKTIFNILMPLTLIALFFMLAFAGYRKFSFLCILLNIIPFILLLYISYSMQQQKKILYYLVVIDGLVFIKAILGIISIQFFNK